MESKSRAAEKPEQLSDSKLSNQVVIERATLAAAVEQAADSILMTDIDGRILYVNPAFTAMTGYTSGEIIGKYPRVLKSGLHGNEFYKELWDTILSGKVWQREVTNRRKNGSLYHEEIRIAPVRGSGGGIAGFIAIKRDISERRAAEETQALLAGIVENSEDSIIACTPEGIVRAFNHGAEVIFGYTSAEVIDRHISMLVSPDHLAALEILAEKLRRGERFSQHEGWCLHKDGHRFQASFTGFPITNGAGDVVAVANILRDVTESKRAEAALRESEERFRSMADSSPSQMWVTNAAGELEFVNRLYREFSGLSCEEALAGKWRSLLHPDDACDYLKAFEKAVVERTPFSAEARVRRADGAWRMVGSRGEPRFSPRGEYLGHIGLRADITERKRAETERQFQHSLIRTIQEVSLDGILVVNGEGRIVSFNKKLFDMWNIPLSKVLDRPFDSEKGAPDQVLLSSVTKLVKDSDAFLKRVQELYADRNAEDQCEIELNDGRTLERYSTSLRSENGEYLARAWFFRDITERKRSELALKESEERFRVMADGCPIGIWVTNEQGKTRFLNRTYKAFCGISSKDVNPESWITFIHPDDRSAFVDSFERALQSRSPFKAEHRCRRADGEWRWVESYAEPRFSANGEFMGLSGTSKDVTERRLAEMGLKESEEKFRELAENIREVFWMMNAAGTEILYIGPAYEQIWGRTCASLYQNPMAWMEAIHRDDRARAHETFMRQLQGESIDSEYRISTPDGQERWIRDRAFPVRDQSGQLVRVAGIAEDVTGHKRYEEELIRARETAEDANHRLAAQHATLDHERKILRAFIDNVPDFMYVKDLESRFLIANTAVARWAGVEKPDDLIGKTDFDFSARELAAQFLEDEQRVIRTRQPMVDREETSSIDAMQAVRYSLTTKVPLFDSAGQMIGIAGISRDITARKAMEDAVHESNRELQEATDWANKLALEAEAANRSKSEFLANMSHEIRTPMNGVLGMNGLLLGSNLDKQQRHYAEVVDASARSLLTVIDDILDYSKVEAGKLEIDSVDFNLQVMMDEFAVMMAERVAEKQLEFICAVAPDVPANLQGDPGRLRQVLINLAGNAMKFTHQGEVAIRVSLISDTDAEVWLRFVVRDTGIGIADEKQKMLFTSFTQVDASTTRKYGGTGLGLAISKKLVELMGGKIGLDSKEGEGSEFWFTLPLAKQPADRKVASAKVSLKGTRILAVDDNATNREVLTAQLQSWGAVVAAVESGAAALVDLRRAMETGSPFDLAILDMMMPGMDGAALGCAILSDNTLKETPLVMMTSLGERGDALRFKEMGFAAYLTKPVRQSDLYDCLATVLNGGKQRETRALITRHNLRSARRGDARILLVEDNQTNQEVAKGMLERLGWRASVAANGKEAILALEKEFFDLVLMDVQMPEMDGHEATRMIRDPQSAVLNHDVPVIATTAHAMQGDVEKCLAAGMSDYLSKPIDAKKLAQMVEKWLKRKTHGASGEAPVEKATSSKTTPSKLAVKSQVFDGETFLERMMGDEEFARDVVDSFVKGLPALLNDLSEGFERSDLESIRQQAHKLKGSAANVGGDALKDVAMKVETAGKAGDLEEAKRFIPELESEAARLKVALREWAKTPPG